MRKLLLSVIAASLTVLAVPTAMSQTYPARPIHLIVNGAPGSLPDLFARPLAEKLRLAMGQSVVIDNRPGAGGMVAMAALKNSPADGYALAMVTNAHVVWNPYLFSKPSYDARNDLAPVSPVASIPMVLAASPALPANTLEELIALAKSRPGQLNYASSSTGSPPHILFELLKSQASLDIMHVPFKSGPDAMNSTLSDRTQLYLAGSALVEPQIRAGKLKALAVGAAQRLPSLPDVPTFAEKGMPGHDGVVWLGVITNKGVPAEIVERLNQEIGKALQTPDMQKIYESSGSAPYHTSVRAFQQRIAADHSTWGPVISQAGIRLD